MIPTLNQGEFIEQTIKSITEQNYENREVIIIDGGSTDDTIEIIKEYESEISYWVSAADKGQAHAINKGLAKATGEIFNWINSDDYLEPGALQEIGTQFANNPDTNIVCGYTRCFWNEDNRTSHEYRMGVKKTAAETIFNVEMNQPGSFYRTEIVREFGGVNESLRYVFDDELWFRYLCKYGIGNIIFTDKRLAQFRLHESSKSVGEGFDFFNKEIRLLHLDILKTIQAPVWLLDILQVSMDERDYSTTAVWDTTYLESEKFMALFASKYINTLFLQGKKKEAKVAMKMVTKNGLFRWNRMMTSLQLKLLLQ